MSDRVECYSGVEYAERPTAVWWQGQRQAVAAVEAQWRFPGGKGFRVRTVEGLVFHLTYTAQTGEWQIRS